MKTLRGLSVAALLAALLAAEARADLRSKAAREAAEYVLKKFGVTVVREGTETLAERIAAAALRHGDDAIMAVRKVGPKALSLADDAGEQAPKVLRLLSKHGEDAAVWVVRRPGGMELLTRFGDDAAEVLIKHKGLAEPLLERVGGPAVKALGAVGPQGGRRLAMMAQGGELAAIGRSAELMQVIARHGDPAMDFIWRNKGPLAVGTTLTAFLAKPEAFIDGTNRLAGTVAENAVRPVVQETAKAFSWLLQAATTLALLASVGGVFLAVRYPRAAAGLAKIAFASLSKGPRP